MKHFILQILFLLLFCLSSGAGEGNLLVNGDFEQCHGNTVPGWDQPGSDKQAFYEIDPQIRHSGKFSLRIGPIMQAYIPFAQFGCKIAEFQSDFLVRGWLRYENLKTLSEDGTRCYLPFIGFWTRGPAGNGFQIPVADFFAGSKEWTYFEKTVKAEEIQKKYLQVPEARRPQYIAFRINVANQPGKVWFDDLELIELETQSMNVFLSAKELSDVSDISVFLQAQKGTFEEEHAEISVLLTDEAGKEYGRQIIKVDGTKQTIRFEISSLSPGKYSVTVSPLSGFKQNFTPIHTEFRKLAGAFDE